MATPSLFHLVAIRKLATSNTPCARDETIFPASIPADITLYTGTVETK